MISQRNITINIIDEENDNLFYSLSALPRMGSTSQYLSGISKMSWKVVEEKWSVSQMDEEIKGLVALPIIAG
jgi:hypothetical protein